MVSLTRIPTGQIAFEGGVDGGRIPLMATESNPTGLKFNELSWLVNGTVRGGGISQRSGWFPLVEGFTGDSGLFQGAFVYQPDSAYAYIVFVAGGNVYRARVDTDNSIEDITNGCVLSATASKVWFCQAEQFLIIQDGINEPLVWEGGTLRKITDMPGAGPAAEMLPVGQAMDYYMGRIWLATGTFREFIAGDIVKGASGSNLYGYRDAVLHATENLYITGGGKFTVPTQAGNIRALFDTANLDTALGEGQLFVATRNTIYSINVTPSRADWAQLSEPLQRVAQQIYGVVADRSVVKINGDVFYQAYDGIRSLMVATRNWYQWGQAALSHNVNRILQFNNRALISYASGVEFDNRLLQTALPILTPVGVAHQAIIPLDFDLITSLDEKLPPVWEGHWEGLDHLQLLTGEWGGLQRCFSFVHSRLSGRIELWEISQSRRFEGDDKRNTTVIEFPAYFFSSPNDLHELDNGELWIDKLWGTVDFTLYYRQDQNPCWIKWYAWSECSARNTCEDVTNPVCYPEQGFGDYCEQYRLSIVLPKAPSDVCDIGNGRPPTWGFSFQVKLEYKGSCRVRGLKLWGTPRNIETYRNIRNTT